MTGLLQKTWPHMFWGFTENWNEKLWMVALQNLRPKGHVRKDGSSFCTTVCRIKQSRGEPVGTDSWHDHLRNQLFVLKDTKLKMGSTISVRPWLHKFIVPFTQTAKLSSCHVAHYLFIRHLFGCIKADTQAQSAQMKESMGRINSFWCTRFDLHHTSRRQQQKTNQRRPLRVRCCDGSLGIVTPDWLQQV